MSNCSTVAVLRLISAVGAPLAGRDVELGGPGAAEPGLTELPSTAGCPLTGAMPDHDLLAVINLPSHVEPDGVGAVGAAAGRLQRVGDSRAGRQRDETGRVHQAHHADHHRLVGPS